MVNQNNIYWRTICLLNFIYKIVSDFNANSMNLVMDQLITRGKTGFMNSKFIGENVRLFNELH